MGGQLQSVVIHMPEGESDLGELAEAEYNHELKVRIAELGYYQKQALFFIVDGYSLEDAIRLAEEARVHEAIVLKGKMKLKPERS